MIHFLRFRLFVFSWTYIWEKLINLLKSLQIEPNLVKTSPRSVVRKIFLGCFFLRVFFAFFRNLCFVWFFSRISKIGIFSRCFVGRYLKIGVFLLGYFFPSIDFKCKFGFFILRVFSSFSEIGVFYGVFWVFFFNWCFCIFSLCVFSQKSKKHLSVCHCPRSTFSVFSFFLDIPV